MAALSTLKAPSKSAFTKCGFSLTPAQEHVAAEVEATGLLGQTMGAPNWQAIIQMLGQLATTLLPLILALFGKQLTPMAVTAKTATCDHHDCACSCFDASMGATGTISNNVCDACCC